MSTFSDIVKEQRIDRQGRNNRAFEARAIYTLAHRARTGTLKGAARLTFTQWLYKLWLKLMKRVI